MGVRLRRFDSRPVVRLPRQAPSAAVGLIAAFVVTVECIRAVRPALLVDSEPAWAVPRLALGLAVFSAGILAGGILAAVFFLWSGRPAATRVLPGLPLRPRAVAVLFGAAILAAAALRFFDLDRLPPVLWEDDVSLVAPTLELQGSWRDFADSVRPVMYGVPAPYGSVGVLYLEAFRLCLLLWGTTVFGLRFLSAFSGVLSVLTAAWLGRTLLPRGGGALAALILAGLRWHLILSRWGWVMIAIAPLLDVAAILAIRSVRKRSLASAAIAGVLVGLAAHVYLAAWIAAAALLGLLLWPRRRSLGNRASTLPAVLYVAAFSIVVLPLFVLRGGRATPYLQRVGHHNVLAEIRHSGSLLPPFAAAADALAAPWFRPDAEARRDLPGRSPLGWVLGIAVAAGIARALANPGEDFSAFLFPQAGAALLAAVAGGEAGPPTGSRFGYLADVAAVCAAAGVLGLVGIAPSSRRRLAAIAAIGLLAGIGLVGARDALLVWPESERTFRSFGGEDTLIGRAAGRWEHFGRVGIANGLGHSPPGSERTIESVHRFRLDPEESRQKRLFARSRSVPRAFRVVGPEEAPSSGERIVERVRDAWGRNRAIVLGRPGPA
jgi:hypothetical protein